MERSVTHTFVLALFASSPILTALTSISPTVAIAVGWLGSAGMFAGMALLRWLTVSATELPSETECWVAHERRVLRE